MKPTFIFLLALFCSSLLFAQDNAPLYVRDSLSIRDSILLASLPDAPQKVTNGVSIALDFPKKVKCVNGLSLGLVEGSHGTVNGMRLSIIGWGVLIGIGPDYLPDDETTQDILAGKDSIRIHHDLQINGLAASPSGMLIKGELNGLGIGGLLFNIVDQVNGVFIGGLSNESLQLNGLHICVMRNAVFFNNGLQMAVVNYSARNRGWQIGLFNRAVESSGIQIGLINRAGDKITPFIAIGKKKIKNNSAQ